MIKFEILEHKADLKIRAYGKSQEEIFLNMMLGMIAEMKPETKKPEEELIRTIKIEAPDKSTLLIDFLNEILYQIQVNKEIYTDIEFKILTEKELKANLSGKKAERLGEDIKAATYNNPEFKKERGLFQATVLFDI